MSFYETATFKDVEKKDVNKIREILKANKDRLNYDEVSTYWCIGSEYIVEYLFDNNETVISPRELEGQIDEIIEDEMGLSKYEGE